MSENNQEIEKVLEKAESEVSKAAKKTGKKTKNYRKAFDELLENVPKSQSKEDFDEQVERNKWWMVIHAKELNDIAIRNKVPAINQYRKEQYINGDKSKVKGFAAESKMDKGLPYCGLGYKLTKKEGKAGGAHSQSWSCKRGATKEDFINYKPTKRQKTADGNPVEYTYTEIQKIPKVIAIEMARKNFKKSVEDIEEYFNIGKDEDIEVRKAGFRKLKIFLRYYYAKKDKLDKKKPKKEGLKTAFQKFSDRYEEELQDYESFLQSGSSKRKASK